MHPDFKRILRLVTRQASHRLDPESIAQQIWIETSQGTRLTRRLIKNRIIDALRSHRPHFHLKDPSKVEHPNNQTSTIETRDELNMIMSKAKLSTLAQRALHLEFYTGLSPPNAAHELNLTLPEYKRLLSHSIATLRNIVRSYNNGESK